MITKRVLLILGAGASMPYGFPSGLGLTNQLCAELQNIGGSYTQDILACGLKWDLIKKFREHLALSFLPSIDAFLEHRHEFIEVGKTCIARSLIPCEIESNLYRGRDRHWYEYLFQKLNTTPERFEENKLAVITFNYDRSFEYFLFIALKHSYGLSDSDAASLVRSIPVVHLHGDLGKIPVLDGAGRPYDPTITPEILKQCASDIRIIHEDVAGNMQFTQAHNLIKEAEIICFLGFGFHPINLERLSISKIGIGKKLYGTVWQMPESEKQAVIKWFDKSIELGNYDVIQSFWWWPILT